MSSTLIEKKQPILDYEDLNFLIILSKMVIIYTIMYSIYMFLENCIKNMYSKGLKTLNRYSNKSFHYKENLALKNKIQDLEYQIKLYDTITECNSSLKNELETTLTQNKKLVIAIENFNDSKSSLITHERNIFFTKLNEIEKILIHESYNDPENLAYEGGKWSMLNLKNQAQLLNIPDLSWNQRSISYVIRKVEQLYQIIDIIKPVYDCETQEYDFEEQDDDVNETCEYCQEGDDIEEEGDDIEEEGEEGEEGEVDEDPEWTQHNE
jgi:hypothetical protein